MASLQPVRGIHGLLLGDSRRHRLVQDIAVADRSGDSIPLGLEGTAGLARANKLGARFAVILSGEEAARGTVPLEDLDSGTQDGVPLARLAERLLDRG